MNCSTGAIYNPVVYSEREAMSAAIARGELVVPVSHRVATLMREAHEARRRKAKARRAMQHASRKRNR
jgi:hypothetical protein